MLKLTFYGWKEDKASRLAAALAYYTIFSLAPILVIVIAVAGLIWQRDAVQAQVMFQIQSLVGVQGADFVAELLKSAGNPTEGVTATIIGIVTLLFGALGVFNELHNALNIIWEVKEEKSEGFLQTIKKLVIDRFLSFSMILGIGFMLLVSLVISAGISALGDGVVRVLPFHELILQVINFLISIGIITILFALIFKFLPDTEVAWQDVWVGSFVTAVLFSVGKTLIGLYLGSSAIASSFGAAGSLVLLLVWIYYSAQILFFGAEFIQVYANRHGSKIPKKGMAEAGQSAVAGIPYRQPQLLTSSHHAHTGAQLEKENQQTAKALLGLITASFVGGLLSAIFGFRKR